MSPKIISQAKQFRLDNNNLIYNQNKRLIIWLAVLAVMLIVIYLILGLRPAQEPNNTQPVKLMYQTTNGHLLNFSNSSLTIIAKDYTLMLDLIGSSVIPVSEKNNSATLSTTSGLPTFKKVTFSNIWPGINVVYRAKQGSIVKSTYYLRANQKQTSVEKIRIRYNHPLAIDNKGNLLIKFQQGELKESAPQAWQVIEGVRQLVPVRYRLISEHEAGFSVGQYNLNYALVIDPSMTWNSFLGDTGIDNTADIIVDDNGNIYAVGSSDTSWGSPIRGYTAGQDAFVIKMANNGTMIWNTYLGGTGNEHANDICIDGDDNIYVCGRSDATWGLPIRAYTNNEDGFAAKLDSNGNLLWNTFQGAEGNDYGGNSITIDLNDNLYITGYGDTNWGTPVIPFSGGDDISVVKLDNDGNLLWNSFYGGVGSDRANGIVVDSNNSICATGFSSQAWGTPVRNFSSSWEGIIIKIDGSGNLVWHTFLGGTGDDRSFGLAIDNSDNLYTSGHSTDTWAIPVRAFTFDYDSYVAKVDNNGNLIWNTFLGGNGDDRGYSIAVDDSNNILSTGHSDLSWGSPWRSFSVNPDAFIAKMANDGSLVWNAFFGGSGNDFGNYITTDLANNVYLSGTSDATWGAPVQPYSLATDGQVVKILDATQTPTPTCSPTATQTPTVTPTTTVTPLEMLLSNIVVYPNPFRATSQKVTIEYTLSEDADVTIGIYSYLGNLLKVIEVKAGVTGGQGSPLGTINQVIWDGRNDNGLLQATGGYICHITAQSGLSNKQEKGTVKIGLIR